MQISKQLALADMPLGKVRYESGGSRSCVYFPTTSGVSRLCVMENVSSAEIAVAGNAGLIGIALFIGDETTPSRASWQSAGYAYGLDARFLKEGFHQGASMQRLLLRDIQALITRMVQTVYLHRILTSMGQDLVQINSHRSPDIDRQEPEQAGCRSRRTSEP